MTAWDQFVKEKITKMFVEKKRIIDIGGGLRISHSNRRDKDMEWLAPYMKNAQYQVLDKVSDYHPDIVGNIHNLPFPDNSTDALVCISVLEHVEEPQRAVEEMFRVLKPGGYCFIAAPFLYYYHPMEGYYQDFYRFTEDGFKYLTRMFSSVEVSPIRGPIATLANLVPFLSKRTDMFNAFDRWLYPKSRQVSGYNVFCIK